jgi:alcohol dehydrogenase, propanol-preferring
MPPIPKQMKAVQVTEYSKPYVINSVSVPTDLGSHDLLVKVAIASYCHTDSMVAGGTFETALPVTGSHEGSGTVTQIGSEVTDFKIGDRVMCGLPLHPCGACHDCLGPEESHRQYCSHITGHIGVHVNGCFAEYVKVDARHTTHLPDEVSLLSAAPLACAGRTIWRGVLQTGLKAGQSLAIVGSGGGLGHLGIQFAKKAKGLNVIAIDARDEGLELSKKTGADVVIDARTSKSKIVAEVQAVTGGDGADATIVLADADDSAALGCAITRMHGTVVQIAQPDEIKIPFQEFVFRDIHVKGSLLCSPEESKSMLEAVAEHGIKVKTHEFNSLYKIKELIDLVHSGKVSGKAVVVVDPEQIKAEKKLGAKF